MRDYRNRNLSQSAKRKIASKLVDCHFHGVTAAAGKRCLQCLKEAKKARSEFLRNTRNGESK